MSPSVRRDVVILACAISAGVHVALAPAHASEGPAAGIGFAAAAAVLAALAFALTRYPRAEAPVAAAALTLAGLIASYVAAATTGVPLLHPQPEPVEGLGLATKAVEAAGLAAAWTLLRHPQTKGLRPWTRTGQSARSHSS